MQFSKGSLLNVDVQDIKIGRIFDAQMDLLSRWASACCERTALESCRHWL